MAKGISFLEKLCEDFQSPSLSLYLRCTVALSMVTVLPFTCTWFSQIAADTWPALNLLNGFCPTLRAGTGPEKGSYQAVRPLHPTENRVITPREAARLQGFPDWFQFSPTKWHSFRQIGNSVSPILSERIFAVIRKALCDGRPQEEQ